ncbi:MAG: general secretion pathway protein GspB [Nitrospirota bacterium]|nr:general secretion pathway protein GspB [Nitrospirota bacterium]
MSYILDALKKSAKDRQRGNLPDMLTVQDIVVERPKKRLVWPFLLAVVLLMNAGALVWWLAFSQTEKAAENPTGNASFSSDVNKAAEEAAGSAHLSSEFSPPATTELKPAGSAPAPLTKKTTSDVSVREPFRSKGEKDVPDIQREAAPHQPGAVNNALAIPESGPAKPKPTDPAVRLSPEAAGALPEVLDESKLYRLSELPPSIRQNLPSFSISALLYSSDPVSRMVSVNGQMMHEGEYLTGGVRLEEIAKDGVIFRHNKIRFRVDIK